MPRRMWLSESLLQLEKVGPGIAFEEIEPLRQVVDGEMVAADGAKATTTYTAEYDGKPYPLKVAAVADMVTLKRVDAHTSERTDTKDGKTVQTYHRVVSKDGKTISQDCETCHKVG